MSNKNVITNLTIKQMVESSAMGFNKEYIARSSDVNFDILGKAFKDTGKVYAKLKIAVETNNCLSDNCEYELNKIKQLEQAPQASLDFLAMILSNVEITEDANFDPNNNYEYTVVNCILQRRPGFSKTDGYDIALHLLEENPDKIDSSHICLNTNMNVCKILMDENIILFKMWNYIYSNNGCMELIKKQDINDINWIYLCKNENPEALDIVRRHVILLNQECFLNLCKNINGVVILEWS